MPLITPNTRSKSVSTRKDSVKARLAENHPPDDERSPSQAANAESSAVAKSKQNKPDDQKDDHEHPCVCDLRLPRKSLSNEERYAKAKDYLRNESQSRDKDSPKFAKTIHASMAGVDDSSNSSAESSKSKKARSKKKAKKENEKVARMKKKLNKVHKILSQGYKIVEELSEDVAGKSAGVRGEFKEDSETSSASGSGSSTEKVKTPRKNIRWKKKPDIAIKLNRTAALRLDNNTYCGYKPPPLDKVDEYFTKRSKRIVAARAKAKAEAEARRLKREAGGSGSGAGAGASREADFKAGQKCEYMRCRRYAK